MTNTRTSKIREIYDNARRSVKSHIKGTLALLCLTYARPVEYDPGVRRVQEETVQLPPNPDSPEYKRQMEVWRFHGLRDRDLQLEGQSSNQKTK